MKYTIVLATLLLGLVSVNASAQQQPNKQKKSEAISVLLEDGTDPVCKMKVKKGSKITHVHKDQQYGFCSESCKARFVKSPDSFLKP